MCPLTHQGPHWLETSWAELPAPSSNLQELWEFPRKSGWGTGLVGTPTHPIPSASLPGPLPRGLGIALPQLGLMLSPGRVRKKCVSAAPYKAAFQVSLVARRSGAAPWKYSHRCSSETGLGTGAPEASSSVGTQGDPSELGFLKAGLPRGAAHSAVGWGEAGVTRPGGA